MQLTRAARLAVFATALRRFKRRRLQQQVLLVQLQHEAGRDARVALFARLIRLLRQFDNRPGKGHTMTGLSRRVFPARGRSDQVTTLRERVDNFKSIVGLTPAEFDRLLANVRPTIEATGVRGGHYRPHVLTTEQRLFSVLRLLAAYDTYKTFEINFGHSTASASRDVAFIVPILIDALRQFVTWPSAQERRDAAALLPAGLQHAALMCDVSKIKSRERDGGNIDYRSDKGDGLLLLTFYALDDCRLVYYDIRRGHIADVEVLRMSQVWRCGGVCDLQPHEALLTDGGFTTTSTNQAGSPQTIRPFNVAELAAAASVQERRSMDAFNDWFRRYRGTLELNYGHIKFNRSVGDDRRLRCNIKTQASFIELAVLLDTYKAKCRKHDALANPAFFMPAATRNDIVVGHAIGLQSPEHSGRYATTTSNTFPLPSPRGIIN